ncbi:MAG: glycosyltransferase family 2 protein, partial [Proteobacteria bacterium]|nr:glycosyltransferase family 2 protein [Pseudomonadota bacterium]
MLPSSLQVSIVTFQPDRVLLDRTLQHLAAALDVARKAQVVGSVNVALIDNSEDRAAAEQVIMLGRIHFGSTDVQMTYLHGHSNIGFGAAHNLVLHGSGADYHLVLNPDVELDRDALLRA